MPNDNDRPQQDTTESDRLPPPDPERPVLSGDEKKGLDQGGEQREQK